MMTRLAFTLLMTSFVSIAHADETVKILSGGAASAKIFSEKKAELEKMMGAPLDVSVTPNDVAIVPFTKGLVDGITSGTNLENTLALAEKKGLPKQNPADYQFTNVVKVVVKIGAHPANPVKGFTKQQISDILAGKITSWEPITGEKKPLKAYIARAYVFYLKSIHETYNNGQESKAATYVVDKDGVLRAIQNDPNAIGFFGEKDKLGNFEPKFFDTEATYGSNLVIHKKAKSGAQKLFDYYKAQNR